MHALAHSLTHRTTHLEEADDNGGARVKHVHNSDDEDEDVQLMEALGSDERLIAL